MTTIAASTQELRSRLRASGLSMRALANRARVSDKTIRLFMDGGPSKAPTIEAIEAAFADMRAEAVRAADNPCAGTVHV